MSYLLCFMVEAPKPAAHSNFWYLLKSCGFIQNCHDIIDSKEDQKVKYFQSLRNNNFFPVPFRLILIKNKTLQKSPENSVFQNPDFSKI